ncbi:SpoIIIAH-like family protein [Ectobacillus sp. sgz5001026]|uniref:SpoIIIAH-like family protein n=1 Tax=Ectobacillus sp. sgz5001026 TaxID=3242473 RepID=UPI0036D35555
MLKKQTVWLLTMLSLVVVLSVYYVTTPDGQNSNVVTSPVNPPAKDKNQTEKDTSNKSDPAKQTTNSTGDEQFAQLRLELEDKRNQAKEQLQEVMTSTSSSADDKSKAMDQLQQLNDVATKEVLIETLIKSEGYKDALVRADGSDVRITVKATQQSSKDANKIIQLVKGEIGPKNVAVKFDPVK